MSFWEAYIHCVHACRLEVTLEKKEAGQMWPYLHADSMPKKHVYLSEREDGLMQEEVDRTETLLEEMKKASSSSSPSGTPPPAKRPRPLMQNPLEDCDTTNENITLYMVSDRGTIFGKVYIEHTLRYTALFITRLC